MAKQQRVYAIGPGIGSNTELATLLAEGWRVTHVATSSSTVRMNNTVYAAFLVEHKETKQQEFVFADPRIKDGRAAMQALAEKMNQGYRIVQTVCAAAPEGGELRDHTVFVLER
ncbi:MAG: hypothetical protein K2P78_13440 [Gemmataceae bacterium]|nr:hypothetical protein [Gemmataceae bacterium]